MALLSFSGNEVPYKGIRRWLSEPDFGPRTRLTNPHRGPPSALKLEPRRRRHISASTQRANHLVGLFGKRYIELEAHRGGSGPSPMIAGMMAPSPTPLAPKGPAASMRSTRMVSMAGASGAEEACNRGKRGPGLPHLSESPAPLAPGREPAPLSSQLVLRHKSRLLRLHARQQRLQKTDKLRQFLRKILALVLGHIRLSVCLGGLAVPLVVGLIVVLIITLAQALRFA